jgi:hypothetical protein
VNIADDHFVNDILHPNQESSNFEIPPILSSLDGEFVFHELSSKVESVIELTDHFLTVCIPNNFIIPTADCDNRISMKRFSDKPMNRFRFVSFVYDVIIGFPDIMSLS